MEVIVKIRYADGSVMDARILSLRGNTMRMAVRNCDDALKVTFSNGRWFSDDFQEIQFEFFLGLDAVACAA